MPRLTLPDPAKMTPAQRAVHDRIVAGPRGRIEGPLRAALHNPELADRWQAFGELLRYRSSLGERQRELAILATGRACDSPFEWYAHRREAERIGIEATTLEALLDRRIPDDLPADERLLLRYVGELNRTHSVSDATYAEALARFGERTLVELTALVGYYTMVAMTLNAHGIPLPPGTEPAFPLPQEAAR